jgi:hypothetical protein
VARSNEATKVQDATKAKEEMRNEAKSKGKAQEVSSPLPLPSLPSLYSLQPHGSHTGVRTSIRTELEARGYARGDVEKK